MDSRLAHDEQLRATAAAKIDCKMKEFCERIGMNVSATVWNLSQGMANSGPHRLDISIAAHTTKVYFTDYELTVYARDEDDANIDARLQQIVHKLYDGMTPSSV